MLHELAASVRVGRVTSEALVAESLERIERLDGSIGSVVSTRGADALAEAAAVDARVASGEDPGPLAGLPLLVKDNEHVAGLPTTFGSLLRRDAAPAERDCEVVARLRAAGAIVVGKTNLPEFAFEGFTSNRLFGDTGNPWAVEWSPGGSSGGSGAALAAGLAPLATGTDGGGSIRIPAAFCGLVGLKPTAGLVGHDPAPSWIDLSTKGPLVTNVADAALLLDVMRGPTPGDPSAAPAWSPRPEARPDRIVATSRMCDYGPLPAPIAALFDDAVAGLQGVTGLTIDRVPPPFSDQIDDDWFTTVAIEELTWLGRDVVTERAGDLTPYLRAALELAAAVTVDAYLAARRRRFDQARVLDDLLHDDAVLVCPTMCIEGFYADGRAPGSDDVGSPSSAYNTQATNITGHPSLSVPAGVSPNGVPFGLQIIGQRFADDLVLAVGAAWEAARPWPRVAPGFTPFGD
ncbi:MAG TPA: amidase [Actinomycetota bacterium]|nr:amidase [Actinomycetota bacterium]